MESRNYTYEVKETKSGIFTIVHHLIIDLNGEVIGEARGEKNAELIVAALNGVAP